MKQNKRTKQNIHVFFLPPLEKQCGETNQLRLGLKYEKGNLLDKMRENKAMVVCLKADAIYFAVEHLGK